MPYTIITHGGVSQSKSCLDGVEAASEAARKVLEEDKNQSDGLRQMAGATLSELVKIQSLNGS